MGAAHRTTRAFTLVEMSIVIMAIALFATFIMPNLYAAKQSRMERTFITGTKGLIAEARNIAISKDEILDLKLSGNRLSVSEESSDPSQQATEVVGLDMPQTITATHFKLAGQDSNDTDWTVHFYPDGTCDAGGIEFTIGQNAQALNITEKAVATIDDQLADDSTTQWPAGTYETR